MVKDKALKDKAMKIKNKDYVMVKDRVAWLDANENGNYSIDTDYDYFPDQKLWVVKATLTVGEKIYTGLAQEIESEDYSKVNFASALENCETSAIGRACAAFGLGIQDSYASGDEMNKASNRVARATKTATEAQIQWLHTEISRVTGSEDIDWMDKWLKDNIGQSPQEVAIFKVKEVVNKIRQIGAEMDEMESSKHPNEADMSLTKKDVKQIKQGMDIGDIPF